MLDTPVPALITEVKQHEPNSDLTNSVQGAVESSSFFSRWKLKIQIVCNLKKQYLLTQKNG